jgi:hypothetical protein
MSASDPQVGFRFRLIHPDGRQEPMLVDSERALIGSAAHCEVRLSPEIVAHEHIEVVASEGVIHFATRALGLAARLPTIDGVTMVEGRWDKGSVLALGNMRISVELVDMATPKAKAPFWAISALIPLLGVSVAALAFAHGPKAGEAVIPEAPVLLPAKESAACPTVASDQRLGLAAEKLRIALAKRERSPFSPPDGFEAVVYFETAAACYRIAAQPSEAAQANHSADALREKLEEDYRLRRVRLEHAFRLRDAVAMKRELVVLIPMTSQHRGPYTDWLAALDRAATAEIDQRGRLAP